MDVLLWDPEYLSMCCAGSRSPHVNWGIFSPNLPLNSMQICNIDFTCPCLD